MHRLIIAAAVAASLAARAGEGDWTKVENPGGKTLGCAVGAKLLEKDGLKFKDLNRNGVLDPYEDWRLDARVRAKDLASKLPLEDVFGLMLYSPGLWMDGDQVTKEHRQWLFKERIRHILVAKVKSPLDAAKWNNRIQSLLEKDGLGVPANNSSDPRHAPVADIEYAAGAGCGTSLWPDSLGLAATFDPALAKTFGEIASQEYRLMGIATALSPQADIATEPRWRRFNQTYGESPYLAAELVRNYADGFQTTPGAADGWGEWSVNAMVKHWPGGGPGEAGRDAHFGRGKYAVYPGGGFDLQKRPFTDGAFHLAGATKMCSAVMPYYTIPCGQTKEEVANGFNREIIQEQLRDRLGYDGVVCTDWGIVLDEHDPDRLAGKPWGVDRLSVAERHLKCWLAGVDQFGGVREIKPIEEGYRIGCKRYGEERMSAIVRKSAERLLMNIFRTGLFENPYVDLAAAKAKVGCAEWMKAGYEAQVRSVMMLKNRRHVLPLKGRNGKRPKVWIPDMIKPARRTFWSNHEVAKAVRPVSDAIASKYFDLVDSHRKADAAIVFVSSPLSGWGYDYLAKRRGEHPYVPISLQYEPYTAEFAREHSLAGGDVFEDFTDRSYRGKSVTNPFAGDRDQVLSVREMMGNKPVIVVMDVTNPAIPNDVEKAADAFLAIASVQYQAALEIVSGRAEPHGLLPFTMPADMRTVEEQCEDLPHDMKPYVDTEGNAWDFAFGLDWSGVIRDARTAQAAKWRRMAENAVKGK